MNEVKVTNVGRRTRDRLGVKFVPKQEEALSVNNRQLLTLRAVKDFKVEVVEPEEVPENEGEPEGEGESVGQELNYSDLNIDEVMKAIEDGKITVDEAIAKEIAGKNRASLLEKLEDNK